MPKLMLILKIGLYLLPLIFGTHFIRTAAFNRYEAVTYECSFAAVLLSTLLIIRQGWSWLLLAMVAVFMLGFIGNAMVQKHFFKALQQRINDSFSCKDGYQKNKKDVLDELQALAAVSIMPSFSRFIEDSKLFNNPGSFIGLLKSLMKRQRFQKKKYLMRECFADNANLIGFAMPVIRRASTEESIQSGGEDRPNLPRVMEANDLALVDKDEKTGLISFDILGFGALLGIWAVLVQRRWLPGAMNWGTGLVLAAVLLVLSFASNILRRVAFGRIESFFYELNFSALVGISFFIFAERMSGSLVSLAGWMIFAFSLLMFTAASILRRLADNKAHKRIKEKISLIVDGIRPDSEVNRTRRRFLNNLRLVSEWAALPYAKNGVKTGKGELGKLIRLVAPDAVSEEECAQFALPAEKKTFAYWFMICAGCLSLAAAVCLWSGIF